MEKKAQDKSSKETLKSNNSSQRIKLNRNNSKEKTWHDTPKKASSRLPRIVRMSTRYNKPIVNPIKPSVDSGDSLPGTSKLENPPKKMRKEDVMPEKIKLSHIPRLKSHKDGIKENSVPSNRSRPSNSNYNQYIPENRNVQRVNLLINSELCPDDRPPPVSVQSTRPIPTLGQIYGHINMIESDRLNDWFTALGTPMASIPSSNEATTNSSPPNELFISASSSVGSPTRCRQENLQKRSTIIMETQENLPRVPKSTNDNIGGWQIPLDLECPTRDNEPAFKTMSLKNTQKSKTLTPKKSQQSQVDEVMTMNTNQTYCVGLSIENPKIPSAPKLPGECCTDTTTFLKQQSTVVLSGTPEAHRVEEGTFTSKSYVSLKPSRLSKTKDANNNTGPSNTHQHVTQVPRVPVPSYTDCFSEVLQKTTNFEVFEGMEPNKSKSSNAVVNPAMCHNTSVIETKDANEMCDADDSTTLDSYDTKQSKSSTTNTTTTTFLKSDATATEWSCKYQSENSSEYPALDSCTFRQELNRRCYDDGRYNEMRERCKTCQRFKRFPSSRYKLPKSFGSWRSGGSIRRLCCSRWNHVWKKTAKRWATWSSKSHFKSRRFRTMHLLRSLAWEDVNLQTTIVLFSEAGTSAIKEQKSAGVTTMFNMRAFQGVPALTETGSTNSKSRHVNSGPSMFPFFHNPKKLSNVIRTDKNLSGFQFPDCQQNQCTSFDQNLTWKPDAAIGGNSVKSCQFEGKTPEQVEQTTSLLEEMELTLVDHPTDTNDLPNYNTNQKTSTPSSAPMESPVTLPAAIHSPTAMLKAEPGPALLPMNSPAFPFGAPSAHTSSLPYAHSSVAPSAHPFQALPRRPSAQLIALQYVHPSAAPFAHHSAVPLAQPSTATPIHPLSHPPALPCVHPSTHSSAAPPTHPSAHTSAHLYQHPSAAHSNAPSINPSVAHTAAPSINPSVAHTTAPSINPSAASPTHPSAHLPRPSCVHTSTVPSTHPSVAPSMPATAPVSPPPSVPPFAVPGTLPSALPFAPLPPSATPASPGASPLQFNSNQIQMNKEDCNTDTIKNNVIMCHNAVTETDVGFPGIFGITSSATTPSGSDITYYRPAASSDITHLISESRTQQALYPILRRFYSNKGSTMNRAKDHLVTGTGTQISPENSIETVSMGVTTCRPSLAECTTSYSNEVINGSAHIERTEMGIQAEDIFQKPKEVIDTQISPLKVNSASSLIGGKKEVFMSECRLIANDAEKEHLACQAGSATPRLGFAGTKLMSISSKELCNQKPLSATVDKALGSKATVVLISTAVGSNANMVLKDQSNASGNSRASSNATKSSKSTSSSETLTYCSNCVCPGDSEKSKPMELPLKVSCGTDPTVADFNYTRSTSARGLESYYETEDLLNNLIKKALISNSVGTLQPHVSEKSQPSGKKSRSNVYYVTTSTNTHISLDTKSIGPTASDVSKLRDMNKTDAEIQYFIEQQEKIPGPNSDNDEILSTLVLNPVTCETPTQTEGIDKFELPTPHKSTSMMTSFCGLTASNQFPAPAPSTMTVQRADCIQASNKSQYYAKPHTRNVDGTDIETNTNYIKGSVTDNLAQTSVVHTTQKSMEVKIYRNCSNTLHTKADVQNSVNDQIISLSRLIGKKRTDSTISSQMTQWINETPVETSLHQTKFPNSHKSHSKNALDTIMLGNEKSTIRKSCIFTLESDNHLCTDVDNPVPYELPTIILSKDSLEDVLPIIKSKDVYDKKSETQPNAMNPRMVDVFTSDNYVSKDVKESILQACPEICETGTESLPPTYSKKSACVLTTQCVLPPLPQCGGGHLYLPKSPDCVFMYGEPRCVVHKVCADAAIQLDLPANKEVKRECVTHSVGQLTSHGSLRDGNPSALIREVLSPKVYKALYETTKLVVSKETKQPSLRNSNVIAARVDAEVDARTFDVPKLKSAGILTSEVVVRSKSRCHFKERTSYCKRPQQFSKKSEEFYKSSSGGSNEDMTEECCEDCMKRQLVTSCRYYSNLLTKQLGRVKNNLAKHLAPSTEKIEQPPETNAEACTMKPSGRKTFACQTVKHRTHHKPIRPVSCCLLSPATSLTNICKYDKAHLKSVYFMLSAIEGRLRRLKLGSPSTYCQ